MAHGVIRLDRMWATENHGGVVSFKYSPSSTDTAIDNGNVVLLGALSSTDREVFIAGTPAATSPIDGVVLVTSVETFKDGLKHDLADFENKAGAIARGHRFHSGDIFSLTADCFASTPAVDNLVELAAGTKLSPVSSATSGSTVVGKIIEKDTADGRDFFVVLVD